MTRLLPILLFCLVALLPAGAQPLLRNWATTNAFPYFQVWTNGVLMGWGSNIVWDAGTTGYLAGAVFHMGASASGGSQTNISSTNLLDVVAAYAGLASGDVWTWNAAANKWTNSPVPGAAEMWAADNFFTNWTAAISNLANLYSVALTNRADTNYTLVNNLSNATWAADNFFTNWTAAISNLVASFKVVTNANQFGATADGSLTIANGARVTNLLAYAGNVGLTVIPKIGGNSNAFQVLNTNGQRLVYVETNDTFTASNATFLDTVTAYWFLDGGGFSAVGGNVDAVNLGVGYIDVSTGVAMNNTTADRVAVISPFLELTNSANVSIAELEYLDGVTAAIQTQFLNATNWANAISNLAVAKQNGSFDISNFFAMGITQMVAGTGMAIGTNGGKLYFTNTVSAGMAALEVMTNNTETAGGIRVGLATNQVWKFPPWAMFATNTSGSNSVEITVQPYRPFAVLDATNIFYADAAWNHIIDEEWQGRVASINVGEQGKNFWAQLATGSTIQAPANPQAVNGAYSVISVVTTNQGTGRDYVIPGNGANVSGFCVLTNNQFLFATRIKISTTNNASDVSTLRAGFSSAVSPVGEAASGIYVMINTNVNTNSFVCVTARSSTRTFSYPTMGEATWSPNVWYWVGFWLDSTGTNAVFFAGTGMTNLTSIATNSANIPESTLVAPYWETHRITGTSVNVITNFNDALHVWIK